MSMHRVHIPTVIAEDRLELPSGVYIIGASVVAGELVLKVAASEDLGAPDVDALYGNIEEDEKTVHFGMFEARKI